jgi:hypothetical protein
MFGRLLIAAALLPAVAQGWAQAAENEFETAKQPAVKSRDDSKGSAAARNPAAAEESAGPRRPGPRNPRVLFITASDCESCARELARLRKPGGDFDAMQSRGWKIGDGPENHVQIVDREAVADLVQQLNVREFPTVACVSDGEIVRSFKAGCTTPLDPWTFGWLLKGENERPHGSVAEPARVKTTGSYPLRGNHWSVDGDWSPTQERVVSHLRGPNHGSQILASYQIEVWSYEELRSLHDDLHERELANGGGSYSTTSYYSPRTQSIPRGADNFSAGRKMLAH